MYTVFQKLSDGYTKFIGKIVDNNTPKHFLNLIEHLDIIKQYEDDLRKTVKICISYKQIDENKDGASLFYFYNGCHLLVDGYIHTEWIIVLSQEPKPIVYNNVDSVITNNNDTEVVCVDFDEPFDPNIDFNKVNMAKISRTHSFDAIMFFPNLEYIEIDSRVSCEYIEKCLKLKHLKFIKYVNRIVFLDLKPSLDIQKYTKDYNYGDIVFANDSDTIFWCC